MLVSLGYGLRESRVCCHIPAVELNNDLAGAVVIELLELANVAYKQEKLVSMLRKTKRCTSLGDSENV